MEPLHDQGEMLRRTYPGESGSPEFLQQQLLALGELSGPWKSADHPQWAGMLREQQTALGLIVQATTRPRFYYPLLGGGHPEAESTDLLISVLLPLSQELRAAAGWFGRKRPVA